MKSVRWTAPVTHLFKSTVWTVLPLTIEGLPDFVDYAGSHLAIKPGHEFHVSLLNGQYIKEVVGNRSDDELTSIFEKSYQNLDVSVASISPELRHCRHRDSESIVAMCEVTGLETIFGNLESKLQAQFERPPTHITLYGQGMPLSTQAHLAERTEVVENAELSDLRGALEEAVAS